MVKEQVLSADSIYTPWPYVGTAHGDGWFAPGSISVVVTDPSTGNNATAFGFLYGELPSLHRWPGRGNPGEPYIGWIARSAETIEVVADLPNPWEDELVARAEMSRTGEFRWLDAPSTDWVGKMAQAFVAGLGAAASEAVTPTAPAGQPSGVVYTSDEEALELLTEGGSAVALRAWHDTSVSPVVTGVDCGPVAGREYLHDDVITGVELHVLGEPGGIAVGTKSDTLWWPSPDNPLIDPPQAGSDVPGTVQRLSRAEFETWMNISQ